MVTQTDERTDKTQEPDDRDCGSRSGQLSKTVCKRPKLGRVGRKRQVRWVLASEEDESSKGIGNQKW